MTPFLVKGWLFNSFPGHVTNQMHDEVWSFQTSSCLWLVTWPGTNQRHDEVWSFHMQRSQMSCKFSASIWLNYDFILHFNWMSNLHQYNTHTHHHNFISDGGSLHWLLIDTQQNSYSISHLLGTVTTQWLPLWWCSHCSLVSDIVTTEQWLHRTHTLLGIHFMGPIRNLSTRHLIGNCTVTTWEDTRYLLHTVTV